MLLRRSRYLLLLFLTINQANSQQLDLLYTQADSLRGSIGLHRAWWNVLHYDLSIEPNYEARTITGKNQIEFEITGTPITDLMQIDLQEPMQIDRIRMGQQELSFERAGNVYWVDIKKVKSQFRNSFKKSFTIEIEFSGKPTVAQNPPWDGGWIFKKDKAGNPWMSVACQGLGASVWYPCKDHQSDEPDHGANLNMIVPESMTAVSNGRLIAKTPIAPNKLKWSWSVTSPINNYNIVPYIGQYSHFSDTLEGEEKKVLDLDYWVLSEDLDKAKPQFERDVKRMLRAFEYWFGPYPFYQDGFKLVQSPHLGMEHQSAVAYGNQFKNGYLGRDLSGSGWGLKWDYIIIHESGHEWFANNITTRDIADMWVHEGFTMYSEVLFIEFHYGKKAADSYLQGLRRSIRNDRPIIGNYEVNKEGSGDMYNKGANLIHTIRELMDNDSLFRQILRGMNRDFALIPTTSQDVEKYWVKHTGLDLQPIFDQYLRTTQIPKLEFREIEGKTECRWTNCLPNFRMPIVDPSTKRRVWVSSSWSSIDPQLKSGTLNANLYIQ